MAELAIQNAPTVASVNSRIANIDVLRGLALAGMLIVHCQYYVHDDGAMQQRINDVIDVLAVNRFYPLFSLLFGAGFALQLERWGERPGFARMYMRRLAMLMVIAVLVITFTGYTVLESYAFWGLAVLAVRKWSNRALIAAILFCAMSGSIAQVGLWVYERKTISAEESNARVQAQWGAGAAYSKEGERLRDAHDWKAAAGLRLRHAFGPYLTWEQYVPWQPLTMMLVGVLAVRLRLFHKPQVHRKLLWSILIYGVLALGIDVVLNYGVLGHLSILRLRSAIGMLMSPMLEHPQACAYASAILLWLSPKDATPWVAQVLASMGRLSLTNYVFQIVVLEVFFASSHPYIWINRVGSFAAWAIILVFQVVFSKWWMSRFRYGPLEWAWRSATFGRWQVIRVQRANATSA